MTLRRWIAVVASAGFALATYLTVVRYAGAEPACAIAHGCDVVQRSSYAELAGVPVALLGVGAYGALLVSLLGDGATARSAAAFIALCGFGFSAWLTYVEVAILHAICIWCVGSALCMTALAVLCCARLLQDDRPVRS